MENHSPLVEKKSSVFFGWPFVMQGLLQASKPESSSASETAADLHSCVLRWFVTALAVQSHTPRHLCIPTLSAGTGVFGHIVNLP